MNGLRLYIVLLLVFCCNSIYSQELGKFPYAEIMVSVNYTTPYASRWVDGSVGYGIGVRGYFGKSENHNRVLAFEYNRTTIKVDDYSPARFTEIMDVTTSVHCFSLPLYHHQKIGSSKKFFFEIGVYWDVNIYTKESGHQRTYDNYYQRFYEGSYDSEVKISEGFFGFAGAVGRELNKFKLRLEYKYSITSSELDGYYDFANRYARFCVAYHIK